MGKRGQSSNARIRGVLRLSLVVGVVCILLAVGSFFVVRIFLDRAMSGPSAEDVFDSDMPALNRIVEMLTTDREPTLTDLRAAADTEALQLDYVAWSSIPPKVWLRHNGDGTFGSTVPEVCYVLIGRDASTVSYDITRVDPCMTTSPLRDVENYVGAVTGEIPTRGAEAFRANSPPSSLQLIDVSEADEDYVVTLEVDITAYAPETQSACLRALFQHPQVASEPWTPSYDFCGKGG